MVENVVNNVVMLLFNQFALLPTACFFFVLPASTQTISQCAPLFVTLTACSIFSHLYFSFFSSLVCQRQLFLAYPERIKDNVITASSSNYQTNGPKQTAKHGLAWCAEVYALSQLFRSNMRDRLHKNSSTCNTTSAKDNQSELRI